MRQRRDESGVTLTELAVVLTIMVIVAASAVPFLGSTLSDNRTRGAAEQVTETLRTARQYAVATTATYRVIFTSTQIQLTCTDGTPAGNVCAPNRPPDITETFLNGATVASTPAEIRFNQMGATTTGVGTVNITYSGGANWQVAVNVAGRVKACTPSCS